MTIEESLIPSNLVSASMDQTLIFWNNKHQDPPIKGKYSGFRRIIEVGEYIIATSTFIEVFNKYPPYQKKMALSGHGKKNRIHALCKFQIKDPNIYMMATGGEGGVIMIWDLNEGEEIFKTTQGQKIVYCLLQYSIDYLISGGTSEAIIWEIIIQRDEIILEILRRIPHGVNNEIYGLLKMDGKIILSYGYNTDDILLKLWNIDGDSYPRRPNNISGLKGIASGLKVAKRKELYLGGDNGHIYIFNWTTQKFKFIGDYHIHNDTINQLCMFSTIKYDNQIITCSSDHSIKICEINNFKIKSVLPMLHTESVTDILLLADAQSENIEEEVISAESKDNTFVEKDDVVLIIGGYKLCIKKDKLFDIAPIFKNYLSEEFAYIVEIPYINSNISFNDILQPYLIQGELPEITEKIYPECIILTDSFPLIKEKCDEYQSLSSQIVDNLFAKNRISQSILDSMYSSPKESNSITIIYILIYRYFDAN